MLRGGYYYAAPSNTNSPDHLYYTHMLNILYNLDNTI